MFVKRLTRRQGLTHRIRVGDGFVLLLSDPLANLARGEEIRITITDSEKPQIKLLIEAPKLAAPVYFDIENPDQTGPIED